MLEEIIANAPTQFVDLVRNAIQQISNNLPFFDGVISNPATGIIGFVESINMAYNYTCKQHLRYFVSGMGKKSTDKKAVQRLYDFISSQKRAEYVMEMMRIAITSSSRKVSTMIGIYLSELSEKGKDISQEDIIISDTLKVFNDFDVTNYICALNPVINNAEDDEAESYCNILESDLNIEEKVTLHKCLATGIVLKNGPLFDGDTLDMGSYYKIWQESVRFYELCKTVEDALAD